MPQRRRAPSAFSHNTVIVIGGHVHQFLPASSDLPDFMAGLAVFRPEDSKGDDRRHHPPAKTAEYGPICSSSPVVGFVRIQTLFRRELKILMFLAFVIGISRDHSSTR